MPPLGIGFFSAGRTGTVPCSIAPIIPVFRSGNKEPRRAGTGAFSQAIFPKKLHSPFICRSQSSGRIQTNEGENLLHDRSLSRSNRRRFERDRQFWGKAAGQEAVLGERPLRQKKSALFSKSAFLMAQGADALVFSPAMYKQAGALPCDSAVPWR